jgi:thymidylate synthase (FAD)
MADPAATIRVHTHGELQLEASCADDLAVVNAARVSLAGRSEWEYDGEGEGTYVSLSKRDAGLIGYLMRERHGTPFEHGYFRFRVKAPIFVFREWHRHRVGHSYNEWSARYSELQPEFYVPEDVVTQTGKPGAYIFEPLLGAEKGIFQGVLERTSRDAYEQYQMAMAMGVAKQQARLFLPVNIYSEMIWSVNPRSLMHFLGLRNAPQAQAEIRAYAEAAESIFRQEMPVTYEAFLANNRVCP